MAPTMITLGCCLYFVGWVWMVVMAFRDDDTTWAIILILLSPAAILYGLKNLDRAWLPLALSAGGIVLRVAALAIESAYRAGGF